LLLSSILSYQASMTSLFLQTCYLIVGFGCTTLHRAVIQGYALTEFHLCCHPQLIPPCSFLQQRAAATVLQAAWRGHAVRQQQAQLAAAATVLQAAYRGRAVRQLLAESAAFATFLQACYRCQRARSAFLKLRAAAVVLQAAWRGRQSRSRWVAGLGSVLAAIVRLLKLARTGQVLMSVCCCVPQYCQCLWICQHQQEAFGAVSNAYRCCCDGKV
jgi:hypothetical protein